MKRASVTEAKNHLSALLDRVKSGEEVTLLERGKPVARMVPVGAGGQAADVEPWLADLDRRGLLARGVGRRAASATFPRLRLQRDAGLVEAVLEERADGR
jgi:prevent-host-death family protein